MRPLPNAGNKLSKTLAKPFKITGWNGLTCSSVALLNKRILIQSIMLRGPKQPRLCIMTHAVLTLKIYPKKVSEAIHIPFSMSELVETLTTLTKQHGCGRWMRGEDVIGSHSRQLSSGVLSGTISTPGTSVKRRTM